MTPNPVSIRASASVQEAVAFLTDTGFSAAPVIDAAGRPVGVISRTDIVVHDRRKLDLPPSGPLYFESGALHGGTPTERPDAATVGDLMTPAVFSVRPETSAWQVAEQMVELNVHRLFVVDADGALVGEVSVLDLLRHLCETV